jgi:AraC-like DNA-binding protein
MLEDGGRPVTVATELGFADQSHLGRHFMRVVGIAPSRYSSVARGAAITF